MSESVAIDIDKLEAGPELDALVAQRVFGIDLTPKYNEEHDMTLANSDRDTFFTCENCGATDETELPEKCIERVWVYPYSTDILAAWDVVEKIREENWWSDYGGDLFIEDWRDGKWTVCNRAIGTRKERYLPVVYAEAETMPHAICKAALKAVEHEYCK